jgi:hypothetical protein
MNCSLSISQLTHYKAAPLEKQAVEEEKTKVFS